MISFSKILVPVAFSPRCAWAAQYGAQLAARFGSELVFLHAGEAAEPGRLEEFVANQVPHRRCRCVWLSGDPAETIVSFAREEHADLIVMPTHAYGRFRRFLLGSVTAKVLHDSDCPVCTGVHQQDLPPPAEAAFHHIICGVDLDRGSIPLIRWARDLAEGLSADLAVVHGVAAADETSDNRGEVELRRYLFQRARDSFEHWLSEAGLDAQVILSGGEVARVIREAALREHAELVIIGRGHTQRALGRLRTCSYSVIRESPCPVLSV